ncbi:MAG: nucleoside-diphosphate kinase [Candidatus Pacearchaeota archaeon]
MGEIEQCLVIIKPDGLVKSLTGNIITALSETKLKIVGAKIVSVSRELAEKHYAHLKDKDSKIFEGTIDYIMGKYHTNRVLALVYHGEDAISKVRSICGPANPEEAHPTTIRGRYGRVHSKTGIFENVIHASDSKESAEREIKLWFSPNELSELIYPTEEREVRTKQIFWA